MNDQYPPQIAFGPIRRLAVAFVATMAAAEEAHDTLAQYLYEGAADAEHHPKMHGTNVAAMTRVACKRMVEVRPDLETEPIDPTNNGWYEYQLGGFHIFLHRRKPLNKSSRALAYDYAGMAGAEYDDSSFPINQPPLPNLGVKDLHINEDDLPVRIVATFDSNDAINGARVFQPAGPEEVAWELFIDEEDIAAQRAEWLLADTPWLDVINRMGAVAQLIPGRLPQAPAAPTAPREDLPAETGTEAHLGPDFTEYTASSPTPETDSGEEAQEDREDGQAANEGS